MVPIELTLLTVFCLEQEWISESTPSPRGHTVTPAHLQPGLSMRVSTAPPASNPECEPCGHLPCCRPSRLCSPPWAARVCLGHSSPAGWPPGPQGPRSRRSASAGREVSAQRPLPHLRAHTPSPHPHADLTGHRTDRMSMMCHCDPENMHPTSDACTGSV